MWELFNNVTKEERIEIEKERAEKQKIEQDLKKSQYYEKNKIKSGAELKKYKETKFNKNHNVLTSVFDTAMSFSQR